MPDYEFIGDDWTDIPSLGLSVKPGEVVTLDEAVNHPLLKPVKPASKAKAESDKK